MGDRPLNLPQISEMSGVPVNTLRFYRSTNQGPPMFKLGRRVVAMESDVVAWIKSQRDAQISTPAAG